MEEQNKMLQGARTGIEPTIKRIMLAIFVFLISMTTGAMLAEILLSLFIRGVGVRDTAVLSYYIYLELILRYGFAMGMMLLYVNKIERRSISTLGFYKKGAVGQYIKGALLAGSGLFVIWSILRSSGQIIVYSNQQSLSISVMPIVIIILVTWVIQGASEEVLVRGYLLPNIGVISDLYTAILVSSIIFAVMHIGNEGVTVISLFNILLCGLLLALLVVKQQSIWGACGFHTVWNLFQGNVFGIAVSGIHLPGTIWQSEYVTPNIINGGVFGMEGSILTTFFMLLSIVVIVVSMRKELLSKT